MDVVGHERIIEFLKRVLAEQSSLHGFLFFGPPEIGKRAVALLFARGLLCKNNEWGGCSRCVVCEEFGKYGTERDFLEIRPEERGGIGIAQTRLTGKFLGTSAQLAARKVVVVDESDQLTPEAQNAFLKTLEEPAGDARLILVTSKPGRLFETVRSRLVPIKFHQVSMQKIVQALEARVVREGLKAARDLKELAVLARGRIGRAFRLLQDPDLCAREGSRVAEIRCLESAGVVERLALAKNAAEDGSMEFLATWQLVVREKLLKSLETKDMTVTRRLLQSLHAGQWAMTVAEDTNVSKRLLLENLVLSL